MTADASPTAAPRPVKSPAAAPKAPPAPQPADARKTHATSPAATPPGAPAAAPKQPSKPDAASAGRERKRPVTRPVTKRTANIQGLAEQMPASPAGQQQTSAALPKREPKLERHYLPTAMPRPRASLTEKSKAPSIGGLIHSMQAKPDKGPWVIAAITSVIWLFIGGLLGWLLVGQSLDDFSGYKSVLGSSSVYILGAAILVPIALFWFIAQLVVRSQEMKLMASAMTEVAIRLAEPDKMAEQKVASVGQTIRRQVSAMDDAISRAIGRAGELEALVHNEVAALERSYSQNEYIIRNLLNELVNEREAIAHNGMQVKDTLQGVGAQVSKNIKLATDSIGQDLNQHGTMSALKLQQAGDQVTSALQTTTDQTVAIKQKISAELPQLLTRMNVEQEKLGKVIDGANKNLGQLDTTLAQRTIEIDTKLGKRTAELGTSLGERASEIDGHLDKRTAEIDGMIARHTGELNKRLVQKVRALDASLAMRTKAMDKTLTSQAGELNKTFLTHREGIDDTMQQKAVEIDNAIASQAKAMDASLNEKARTIDEALTMRLEAINQQAVPRTAPPANPTPAQQQAAASVAGHHQPPPQPQTDPELKKEKSDLSMLRGSEALQRAMTSQSNDLNNRLENNSASLDKTIHQQNELSQEITELSGKHSQLLREQVDQTARIARQFSAQGNDLKATAGLLDSPDMKMSAMMGPQQNKARAILADIIARNDRMEKDRLANMGTLENTGTLVEETGSALKQLLVKNASPRAEQAMEHLEKASLQSRQNTSETGKWMEEYAKMLSRHVVEMVSGMSRSSSRTKMLPGEVANTSTDVRKSVEEQLQALDALAQIQGASVSTSQTATSRTGAGSVSGSTASEDAPRGPRQMPPPVKKAGSSQRQTPATGPAPRPNNTKQPANGDKKPSQWSFGDLLARVADTDTEHDEQPLPSYQPATTGDAAPVANRKSTTNTNRPDPVDVLRLDDIARALDSHTAALAWKRFQAGEPDVFTRRLYTADGQATFDQISNRYQNDDNTRLTVEKYVSDFEGLMNEAREKDPSGRIIQNYLTSESGRTYLMLAHISGRFG